MTCSKFVCKILFVGKFHKKIENILGGNSWISIVFGMGSLSWYCNKSRVDKRGIMRTLITATEIGNRDFRLPPPYTRDLPSSGILRRIEWCFCPDVSGQPICPIFKGQEVQDERNNLM
jgi:hypothetical protein